MKRRTLLFAGTVATTLALVPRLTFASGDARSALTESNLVYLSPIKSSGQLSSCQAEVWYVTLGADVLVCTATSSWRSQAPRKGIANTRVWVGDLGSWKSANYQSLPVVDAVASVETDSAILESALQKFGDKYPDEWGTWEGRFRSGLEDGSRTMLRYKLS